MKSGNKKISDVLGKALYVPCHVKISKLLAQFQKAKAHMAIVLDDYGGTMGIATLEDVIEELVGDIWDEHDEVVELFTKNPDGSVTVNGNARTDDLFDYFDVKYNDDDDMPQTVNGWVTQSDGQFPGARRLVRLQDAPCGGHQDRRQDGRKSKSDSDRAGRRGRRPSSKNLAGRGSRTSSPESTAQMTTTRMKTEENRYRGMDSTRQERHYSIMKITKNLKELEKRLIGRSVYENDALALCWSLSGFEASFTGERAEIAFVPDIARATSRSMS